ncbi:MAG: DNA polymerase III subunit gamma/tau [Acidobacteriota bacterium]
MQYQVLARKWRPQTFDDLVGQPHVSRSLLNALKSDRVAHAFLFSGPRGSGKTTTARILAKALNCHEGKPGEPCGRCPACVEIAAGNCMDVIEIDAASNRGIDEIRELRENVRYHPARDRRKVFIIDEVHMLTPEAFNALLKTLEEPPPHVVFIMATTEYHKIPATILSRCQQYTFRLIPYDLILGRLDHIARAEEFRISRTALEQIVFSSGGSMRDAMSALDQVVAFSGQAVKDEDVNILLNLVEPAILAGAVRAIAGNDVEGILKIVADLTDSGHDLQNFCRRLLSHIRNLMVVRSGVANTSLLGVPDSLLPELKEQAALFSSEDLLRSFDALVRVESELKHSTQPRFHLEMGLIELAQIPRLRPLEDVISDLQKLLGGDAPVPPGEPAPRTARSEPARRPAPAAQPSRPGAAGHPKRPAAGGPADDAVSEPAVGDPVGAEPPPGEDPRKLLLDIAGALQRASLEPILQALSGARQEGDAIILESGEANEFQRRQLKDNLEAIGRAAARVVGHDRVRVVLAPGSSNRLPPAAVAPPADAGPEDILERAKREPVVRAFLEVFPGPVKAEKDIP